jgi:hypothetical protein
MFWSQIELFVGCSVINKKFLMGMIIRIVAALLVLAAFVGGYHILSQDENTPQEVEDAVVLQPETVGALPIKNDAQVADDVYVKDSVSSRITGLPCEDYQKRSLAIVYSGDPETRPYFAGITDASFVVEMDHRFTHGGTRVMGIFDCARPAFVGPMRSGRVDFVGVAGSFDAIYVPWGGDSVSKGLLKKRVVDHIDCNSEVYPGGNASSCFRRSTADVPLAGEDRAFSSALALTQQATDLGYRMTSTFAGYDHQGDASLALRPQQGKLSIDLERGYRVQYQYDQRTNAYERFFEGSEEYDANIRRRVAPKNVIVVQAQKGTFYADGSYVASGLTNPWDGISAEQRQSASGGYPNFAFGDAWFDTVFGGTATFYMDGKVFDGSWKKQKRVDAPYEFYHVDGKKIKFVPGQIWLHVMDLDRDVTWQEV